MELRRWYSRYEQIAIHSPSKSFAKYMDFPLYHMETHNGVSRMDRVYPMIAINKHYSAHSSRISKVRNQPFDTHSGSSKTASLHDESRQTPLLWNSCYSTAAYKTDLTQTLLQRSTIREPSSLITS